MCVQQKAFSLSWNFPINLEQHYHFIIFVCLFSEETSSLITESSYKQNSAFWSGQGEIEGESEGVGIANGHRQLTKIFLFEYDDSKPRFSLLD